MSNSSEQSATPSDANLPAVPEKKIDFEELRQRVLSRFQVAATTTPDSATPLSDDAHKEAAELVKQYERNLKRTAGVIAEEQKADRVIVPHIKEAHSSLRRWGLGPKPVPKSWYKNHDNQTAIGGVLLGLAPTAGYAAKDIISSDLAADVSMFTAHPVHAAIFVFIVPIIVGAFGIFCMACGIMAPKE